MVMKIEDLQTGLSTLEKWRNPFEEIKTVLGNFSKDLKTKE
jgi:hypothetical protein